MKTKKGKSSVKPSIPSIVPPRADHEESHKDFRVYKIYSTSTGPQISLWGRFLEPYGFKAGGKIRATLSPAKIEIELMKEGE